MHARLVTTEQVTTQKTHEQRELACGAAASEHPPNKRISQSAIA
jgi:hypothetical protein